MQQRFRNFDLIGLVLWVFRAVIIILILWGTIATIIENPYSPRAWIDFFVYGIAQGSMYALIAIGYTLVYGVLFMINFAHGEFFMSGILPRRFSWHYRCPKQDFSIVNQSLASY
jgi:branched-chain amino acid transport system permease protein